jgi:hypothetical protein
LPENEPAPGPIRGTRTDPIGGLDINDEGLFAGEEAGAIVESGAEAFEGIAKAGEFAGPIGAAVVAGYGIYKFADWAGGGSAKRDQKYTDRYNAVRKLRDDLPKLKEQLNDMRGAISARQTKMEAYGVEWSDLKLIGSKWIRPWDLDDMLKDPPAPTDNSLYSKTVDVNNLGQPLGNGTIPSISEQTYKWWSQVGEKLQQALTALQGIERQQTRSMNEFDFRSKRNLLIAKHAMRDSPDQAGVIDNKNRTIDWDKIGNDQKWATKDYESKMGGLDDLNYETDLTQKLKDETAKIDGVIEQTLEEIREQKTVGVFTRQYDPKTKTYGMQFVDATDDKQPPTPATRDDPRVIPSIPTTHDDPTVIPSIPTTRDDPTVIPSIPTGGDNPTAVPTDNTTEDMDIDDDPVDVGTGGGGGGGGGGQPAEHTEDRVFSYVDHMINPQTRDHLLETGDFQYPEDVMTYGYTNSGLFASELVHLNHGGVFPQRF